MSHKSIPSDFVKSVLHNGVGRYVCQLQRLTIKFCKSHASSRGVRYVLGEAKNESSEVYNIIKPSRKVKIIGYMQ